LYFQLLDLLQKGTNTEGVVNITGSVVKIVGFYKYRESGIVFYWFPGRIVENSMVCSRIRIPVILCKQKRLTKLSSYEPFNLF
jgi:hypothetical protein